MRWRHHESMHAGLRIWEIWTPELLRPAHVEAARNRRSRVSDRLQNNAAERRSSPRRPQRRTARTRGLADGKHGLFGPRSDPAGGGLEY
jgi:hypothetical protein